MLASPVSVENMSQGGAYVHNLVAGAVRLEPVRDRATPYPRPHSTQVAGYGVIEGGDDRWIGNVFLAGARGRDDEPDALTLEGGSARVIDDGGELALVTNLPEEVARHVLAVIRGIRRNR